MPIYTKIKEESGEYLCYDTKDEENLNFYALCCNLQLTNTAILTIV